MGYRYTKLFEQILESTIWCEPDSTRVVWITMLAMSDRDGEVLASVPGLAKRANVSIELTRAAIACFLAPDADSRTKDYEGRRIAEIEGGWQILNHAKYRDLLDAEAEKERKRKWWAKHRSGKLSTKKLDATSGNSQELDGLAQASTTTTTPTGESKSPFPVDKVETPKPKPGWWSSEEGIVAAGKLVGMTAKKGESFPSFKARIEARLVS